MLAIFFALCWRRNTRQCLGFPIRRHRRDISPVSRECRRTDNFLNIHIFSRFCFYITSAPTVLSSRLSRLTGVHTYPVADKPAFLQKPRKERSRGYYSISPLRLCRTGIFNNSVRRIQINFRFCSPWQCA